MKNNQLRDGGWNDFATSSSDVLTTNWVIMGITSLGQNQTEWFKQDRNPWHVLAGQLFDTGCYVSIWYPGTIDWFSTKHALQGLLGKSWPIISTFKQPTDTSSQQYNNQQQNSNNGGTASDMDKSLASSTTPLTMTTSSIVSTTISTATSTPTTTTLSNTTNPSTVINDKKIERDEMEEEIKEYWDEKMSVKMIDKEITKYEDKKNENEEIGRYNTQLDGEQLSDKKVEQILSSNKNIPKSEQKTVEHLIDTLPIDTPTRAKAKKALAISGSGALAIGLYLGFKLLKNLV